MKKLLLVLCMITFPVMLTASEETAGEAGKNFVKVLLSNVDGFLTKHAPQAYDFSKHCAVDVQNSFCTLGEGFDSSRTFSKENGARVAQNIWANKIAALKVAAAVVASYYVVKGVYKLSKRVSQFIFGGGTEVHIHA